MQQCTKCNQTKTAENFTVDKRSTTGFCRRCKDCLKEYNSRNKEKFLKCNRELYKKRKENKEFIERRKEESKRYREKYKEKLKGQHKKYLEKARLRTKKYVEENKDIVRKKASIRQKNNRGYYNAIGAKRRAAQLQATPSWLSKQQLIEIKMIYIEAQKLTKNTGIVHHVDHIIPLLGKNVRGLHVPWNLQILTAEENKKKTNKVIDNG